MQPWSEFDEQRPRSPCVAMAAATTAIVVTALVLLGLGHSLGAVLWVLFILLGLVLHR